MNFQNVLHYVPSLIAAELPAEVAHYKMAPLERMEVMKNIDSKVSNPRVAAVMMLLYPKNEIAHLVLIVRNAYNGVHSSQIAFPGGKYEKDDGNYAYTALRETHEEIGVLPGKIEVIKAFTPTYIPPSNFIVHPFWEFVKKKFIFGQIQER
ncbi:CoA pyrophosphatase [Flavobacterium sp. 140616W15]|uniref:NUDIX hydrolase n=1 Tax=Flavobacterium sp. 140616W15 TaxID=2478552 RepID=UPI00268086EA